MVNFSILRQSQSACLLKFPKPLTSYDFFVDQSKSSSHKEEIEEKLWKQGHLMITL